MLQKVDQKSLIRVSYGITIIYLLKSTPNYSTIAISCFNSLEFLLSLAAATGGLGNLA
jgi:hypothetical protein